jgi:EpsD family peptidyl-prolyl cis-trans isomerase
VNEEVRELNTNLSFRSRSLLISSLILSLSNCGKANDVGGQVLARAGSDEITSTEVSTEFSALQIPLANQAENQRQIIDKIIDRRLLAAQAQKSGLDKSPEFVAARMRSEEGLLAGIYVANLAEKITASPEEVAVYIKKNPQKFSERKIFITRQLSTISNGVNPRKFSDLGDEAQVIAALKDMGHKVEVRRATFDTSNMSADAAELINQKKVGEAFSFIQGTNFIVNFISEIRRPPVGDISKIAETLLRREKLNESVKEEIQRLRSTEVVKYRQ